MSTDAAVVDAPLPMTGDREADDELALLRKTSEEHRRALRDAENLGVERQRLVLSLRARGVRFVDIAAAAGTTEQIIYKVRRQGIAAQERGEL